MRVLLAVSVLAVAYGQATCSTYCTSILANCVGNNAVFTGADAAAMTANCNAECAFFAATTAADTNSTIENNGNNLGCRDYHAAAAAMDAAVHCPHARPDSTFCASAEARAFTPALTSGACDNYCDNMMMTCPTQALLGGNRAACINACARFMDQATPVGTYPVPAAANGVLTCRLYHVAVARTDAASATAHCPHADITGDSVCPNAFCAIATSACNSTQTGYSDAAACSSIWANIPAGTRADTTMDTQGCRAYHLSVALSSPANALAHCAHTGQSGSPGCGTPCDAYCSQYASACANITGAAAYADAAACNTACTAFSTSGMMNAASGDTLQCRLYHLGVAQGSATAAGQHCPHASQTGGGVCVAATTSAPTAAGSGASTTAVSALALVAAALFAFFQ